MAFSADVFSLLKDHACRFVTTTINDVYSSGSRDFRVGNARCELRAR